MTYSDDKDDDQKVAFWVVGSLITLIVAAVLTLGSYLGLHSVAANANVSAASKAADEHLTTMAENGHTAKQAQPKDDESAVLVEKGVVKFYFAVGKTQVASNARDALSDVVKGVQAGQKAIVSGYHDTTGNAAVNAKIAKNRALAVRDALVAVGVPADRIELKKPADTQGSGDPAQARRVEVVLGQ